MGHGDRLVRARRDRPQSIGLRTRRRRVGRTFGRSVIHDVFIVVVINVSCGFDVSNRGVHCDYVSRGGRDENERLIIIIIITRGVRRRRGKRERCACVNETIKF